MGWLQFSMHRPVKEWFMEGIDSEAYEVLDVALVKRNTMYAAIKVKKTGQVYCVVYLIRWSRDYHYNFAYKPMDEFCGPCEIECPERIFKLLTPLTDKEDPNGWARNWRKGVEEFHADRKKFKGNFVFKLKDAIEFTNGSSYQYFKKEGRKIFAGVYRNNEFYSHCKVRIRGLYHYDFEKIKVAI